MSIDPDEQLGKVIQGYELKSVLGKGAFSVVFVASKEDQLFAVKCLFKENLNEHQLALQLNESQVLMTLDHPHIIRFIETISTPEHLYLVIEYCDSDLFDTIADGHFNPEQSKTWFYQLSQAVGFCHENGIYHRDLKPENVLLKQGQVKLADFGLCTRHPLSNDFGCGSVRYMAPECLNGKTKGFFNLPYSTAANDVWSMAIILINMLTGKNPWREPCYKDKHFSMHFSEQKDVDSFEKEFGFHPDLVAILRQAFDLDPFQRPTAREFGEMVMALPILICK